MNVVLYKDIRNKTLAASARYGINDVTVFRFVASAVIFTYVTHPHPHTHTLTHTTTLSLSLSLSLSQVN